MDCPYCNRPVYLVNGKMMYPHRPDLYEKKFYLCIPCNAYVGCHPGTTEPLGRLANAELRAAKIAAHAAFDPLWRTVGNRKRSEAYRWLADKLGIRWKDCHIGMFDVETCKRVVEICNEGELQR
jgi:NAD-dependent aldehyde dehydrogenases